MSSMPARWICDTCGEPIEDTLNNYVQWLEVEETEGKTHCADLGIRHNTRDCLLTFHVDKAGNRARTRDTAIQRFLGDDGLTRCLAYVAQGVWPLDEGIELIKRLFTPGYEEARLLFAAAADNGLIECQPGRGFCNQEDIVRVLEHKDDLA